MKSCPKCLRGFGDDAGFCPEDGIALQSAQNVLAAPSNDSRVGARLAGRYEVRRVVADGGMGRVYEGIDLATDSRVAIKVLHPDVAQDPVSLERFRREYEISRELPHGHIVKVFDFQCDSASGAWLLVMEFLDGEELRYVLKREETIRPERVIRMLSQVAIGLDEAHARNIVHRDLKPDNLFLCGTREGDHVKVLDFGSVKDKNSNAKKLTALGMTIGSPYYMAPEQAQGLETLDARADVFALAAITYECLTGKVPFSGSNGPSILLAILTKDPLPISQNSAKCKEPLPPSLDDVLEEGLAKHPNHRQASVGALADAVGRAFGLDGDHHAWARIPEYALREKFRVPAKPVAVVADPFAGVIAGTSIPSAPTQSAGSIVPGRPQHQGEQTKHSTRPNSDPVPQIEPAVEEVAGLPPRTSRAVVVAVVALGVIAVGLFVAVMTLR